MEPDSNVFFLNTVPVCDGLGATYLEDGGLVVFSEVVGKDVGVHQGPPALTQDIQALLQELDLCTTNNRLID
jgi:hypothetical protein